jgi:hypothetical protein
MSVALLLALAPPLGMLLGAPCPVPMPQGAPAGVEAPVARALADAGPDVVQFDEHLVFLASPFLGGRLPGTRGMELAKDYVQFHLERAGLEPAFAADEGASWRQPFQLGSRRSVAEQSLQLGELAFAPGRDFETTGHGASGSVDGDLVFVGYGVEEGPDGYRGFPEGTNLEGKVCVLLRFEPLNAEGLSRWARRGWSPEATFQKKFRALAQRGAAAILLVNTPGAADPRADSLLAVSQGVEPLVEVPLLHLTSEAGQRLVAACGGDLAELRARADAAGVVAPLGARAALTSRIEEQPLVAENVGGLLRGRGALASEVVVVGAHLDHLGTGSFGSRDAASAGRVVHPGADDNASGVAGILLMADWLQERRRALPEEAALRSVLFLAFSAEESGLNGARAYVQAPIAPLDRHALMLNFDMIGRIVDRRLSVSGVGTAEGLDAWLAPRFASSQLVVEPSEGVPPASDHWEFYRGEVPVLFGIIPVLHADYHTPRDTAVQINRVDAVRAARLFGDIAWDAAQRPEPFRFRAAGSGQVPTLRPATPQEQPRLPQLRVSFGVVPGPLEPGQPGIRIATVVEDSAAEAAGVQVGDLLVEWGGKRLRDVPDWVVLLAEQEPGDEVAFRVRRGEPPAAQELSLTVELRAKR